MAKHLWYIIVLLLCSCGGWREAGNKSGEVPPIFPDYVGVTVPANIAPLNFEIADASRLQAVLSAGNEEVRVTGSRYVDIDPDDWRTLIAAALKSGGKISVSVAAWTADHPDGVQYEVFDILVSPDEVDNWVAYRQIPPSYELWSRMGIYERDLSSYDERAIVTNKQNNNGCVNCHSFAGYSAEKGMVFHARGRGGGTVVYQDGTLRKIMLEQLGPQKSGTYPMWHPSGNWVVFSSNYTRQSFYAHSQDKIEVYDQRSDLILYNVRENDVVSDERFCDSLSWETFPAFSPDGKWLYFCTAPAVRMPIQWRELHYSIVRVPFDEKTGSMGSPVDTVYSAARQGGSASFPRISPDGKYLLFTWAECATFPIHHKEADLKMINLESREVSELPEINSPDVDSYHSWSSSGRWVVLSSKRIDGRYTRLFLSHWDGKKFSKPMLLPQRDPEHNRQRMYSYNIPEFLKAPIEFDSDEMASLFVINQE